MAEEQELKPGLSRRHNIFSFLWTALNLLKNCFNLSGRKLQLMQAMGSNKSQSNGTIFWEAISVFTNHRNVFHGLNLNPGVSGLPAVGCPSFEDWEIHFGRRIGKVVRARVCHRSDRRPLKGNPGQKYQLALSLKILCIWIIKNLRVYLAQVKVERIMVENK